MNKQTKMLLGVALVGIAGYMIYTQQPKQVNFLGLGRKNRRGRPKRKSWFF